jgi:prevent-host-death family protein
MMSKRTWTVAEAKAKFSELIEHARTRGPQTITRDGPPAVVVVSPEEWQRKAKRTGNLAEFFAASPLRESGLVMDRTTIAAAAMTRSARPNGQIERAFGSKTEIICSR